MYAAICREVPNLKILVLSDSHGSIDNMIRAIETHHPDHIIFLGDGHRDFEELQRMYFHIPMYGVLGNCDRGSHGPEQHVDELDGIRIFACHGHAFGVKTTLLHLYYAALERNAAIALYGHTHAAKHEYLQGMHFFNPGSCGGLRPSCGIITIENGTADFRIHRITFENTEEQL